MRTRRTSWRRGFTLMELLVVIGIILVMTALSIPAISKFMDGQTLQQSGRIMQSAFNECRRAAITQRARNYLVFFRDEDPGRPGLYRWGVRRYREKVGFDGDAQFLLPGAQFDLATGTGTAGGNIGGHPVVGYIKGLQVSGNRIPVFDGQPDKANDTLFPNRRPLNSSVWLEFRRDGTIEIAPTGSPGNVPQLDGLFDPNVPVQLEVGPYDTLVNSEAEYDFNIRESAKEDATKRCFVDIDLNTGRIRFRVLQAMDPN